MSFIRWMFGASPRCPMALPKVLPAAAQPVSMEIAMHTCSSRLLITPLAAALAGCAIVSSERLSDGARDGGQGVAYALPMARVPVVLSANAGQIVLRLEAPLVLADPDHTYIAQRVSNPFSADEVTIAVDPATGFLASVSAVGKDETLTMLEKLLLPQQKGTPESKEAEVQEIYRTELNPADPVELQQEAAALSQALKRFLDSQAGACAEPATACAEYLAIRQRAPTIELSGRRAALLDAAGRPAAVASAAPADCRIGVCYRQPQPFVLKAALGASVRSVIVNIPNASPLIAVPLERHAFVTTSHTLAFEQGTLKSATVDRPSSALAFASSPLALASGVISSITKPLSEVLKIDTSGQFQAKADEAQAKAQAVKDMPPPPDTSTPPKTLATLTLGKASEAASLPSTPSAPAPAPAPATRSLTPGASGSARP
jgi:hypothetical protein